ncbi:hypothetical protein [Alicyclobacillus sp. SP_1]|uniref:hypothetical protein n=1 Tax=Alicyclobacillus sp. SP_1 TaxID=2942475 RepID=UPI0021585035|nr:hypothetical protein [Alicyclobacillus sp. SP_1]
MKWVLVVTMLVILFVQTHLQVLNMATQDYDETRIENALRLACRNATLQVVPSTQASGEPVFDQTVAFAAFESSLAQNLDLNPATFEPEPNSMLTVAPKILSVAYIDWSDVSGFPYTYVNTTYDFTKTVATPSIFVEVQMTIPSDAPGVSAVTVDTPVMESYHGEL